MSPGVDALVDAELERTLTEYLAAHPDFFERHHELLATLRLPHGPGQTVSLVERQLGLLCAQSDQLRARLEGIIAVARENELLHDRLHRLTLALLDAGDFDAVLATLRTELQAHFQADAVALRRVAADELQRPADPSQASGALVLRELVATGQPRCGALGQAELAQVGAVTGLAGLGGPGHHHDLCFAPHPEHRAVALELHRSVREDLDGATVPPDTRDIDATPGTAVVLRVGKRHFARIVFD